MDDRRFTGCLRPFDRRLYFRSFSDELPVAPHGNRHLVVAHRGMIVTKPVGLTAEHPLLGGFLHTIGPINCHQDNDRQIISHGGFQLHNIESKGTVTGHTVNR